MSAQKMEATGCVNMKFIVFLKGTLGKLVAANALGNDFINLEFWKTWPRKFYNVRSYDNTKEDFEGDVIDDNVFGSQDEDEVDTEDSPDSNQNDDQREQNDSRPIESDVIKTSFLYISNKNWPFINTK